MTQDTHKDLAARGLQAWSSRSSVTLDDVYAPHYINHQEPYVEGGVSDLGLDAWKKLLAEFHEAFSDVTVTVSQQVAEGDTVATRWQFNATHTGHYIGAPPTGARATWTGITLDRIEGGKIVETWTDWDKYRLFETLGMLGR